MASFVACLLSCLPRAVGKEHAWQRNKGHAWAGDLQVKIVVAGKRSGACLHLFVVDASEKYSL